MSLSSSLARELLLCPRRGFLASPRSMVQEQRRRPAGWQMQVKICRFNIRRHIGLLALGFATSRMEMRRCSRPKLFKPPKALGKNPAKESSYVKLNQAILLKPRYSGQILQLKPQGIVSGRICRLRRIVPFHIHCP